MSLRKLNARCSRSRSLSFKHSAEVEEHPMNMLNKECWKTFIDKLTVNILWPVGFLVDRRRDTTQMGQLSRSESYIVIQLQNLN